MTDVNHIFLFIAILSPLAVLGRAWMPEGTSRGWRVAALVVLAITGVAWIFFRDHAGYIGGGAWIALLFLPAIGLRRVAELSAVHRYKSARKLARLIQILHPSNELREQVHLFRTLEARQAVGAIPGPSPRRNGGSPAGPRLQHAPVVIGLIILNVLAFAVELCLHSWNRPQVLYQLGALEPNAILRDHQYWRFITALFLHYGIIHLLFNLFALYILGPPLERVFGAVRFLLCYVISGLGSGAGVIALTLLRVVQPAELVGASGCVMGIVGAWAGFLLRHRHAPQAKRRLSNIVIIILVQIAFDISTPQVSTSAHLCGLLTGFVLGLMIAPKEEERHGT